MDESRNQNKGDILEINDMLSTKLKIDTSNFIGANSVTRFDSIGSTVSDQETSLIIPPTQLDKTLVALRKMTSERSKSVLKEKLWGQSRVSEQIPGVGNHYYQAKQKDLRGLPRSGSQETISNASRISKFSKVTALPKIT